MLNPFNPCMGASGLHAQIPMPRERSLRGEEALLQGGRVRRQEANLRSLSPSGIPSPITELGEGVGMRKCWRAGFDWQDIYGQVRERGISTGSSWTADRSFLKGFQCSGSGHVWSFGSVRGETLVPGLVWGQNCHLCAYFGCMTYSFVLLSLKNNSE